MSKARETLGKLKQEHLTLKEALSICVHGNGGKIFKVDYTTVKNGLLETVTVKFSDHTALHLNKFIDQVKEETSLSIATA